MRSIGSGERGIEYMVQSTDPGLERVMELRAMGWEGAGWGKVCIENWEGLEEGEHNFVIEGRSVLYGAVATVSHSFNLSFISPFPLLHQATETCSPSLWDTSTNLYGIQTYPSNVQLFPSSLRSFPFTITTKVLSPCENIGMSKDILLPFSFNWTFLEPVPAGLVDINPNDWFVEGGAVLNIPSLYLQNRDAFPMDQPVGIEVCLIFYFAFFSFNTYFFFFKGHCNLFPEFNSPPLFLSWNVPPISPLSYHPNHPN